MRKTLCEAVKVVIYNGTEIVGQFSGNVRVHATNGTLYISNGHRNCGCGTYSPGQWSRVETLPSHL